MRKFLLFSIPIALALAMLVSSMGAYLAYAAPFQPGSSLFPLQEFAEEKGAFLFINPTGKANYYLDLSERRVMDLLELARTDREVIALKALDNALDQAEIAIAAAPDEDLPALMARLANVVTQIEKLVSVLTIAPIEDPDTVAALLAQVETLRSLLAGSGASTAQSLENARKLLVLSVVGTHEDPSTLDVSAIAAIDPRIINFPAGSLGAQHTFFPLGGGHAGLACESCHKNGQFSGTSSQCIDCHRNVVPANHYPGDCASCHTILAWDDIHFNHQVVATKDCQSCHARPKNHFSGQCSACHSTQAWKPARFNHEATGAKDCQSCHTRPKNHFSGQCSNCHSTSAWRPAKFDHTGLTDCQSCHKRPSNHFSGQCSACHTTSAWKPANFNHTGLTDCQS